MKRSLHLMTPSMIGNDVEYAQRLLGGRNVFNKNFLPNNGAPTKVWGDDAAKATVRAKYLLGYAPRNINGSFGTKLERYLRGYDKLPRLYQRRAAKRAKLEAKKPKPPIGVGTVKLIEPRQGFSSLNPNLWKAYSIGIANDFTDLGTFASKPGDHGHHPSDAFDLGDEFRFRFLGWAYLKARRQARYYWKHREELNVDYVILGRRIISRAVPVWHPLTTGDTSHDFHIHVTGTG